MTNHLYHCLKLCGTFVLVLLFPCVVFSADHNVVSFSPSPGDLSIQFLGNIFGVVDGVLEGSGSQIVGAMFGVFNAAVIALGGIVLLYMLLVSTLNMSNEGQLLGQKWSTLWIPVRSTLGVGLLLPQASGYCVIQIFIMFVVVQGVGAADSIWGKALSYLNRGGVIVHKQMQPNSSANANDGSIMDGAMGILAGQVCMQALNVRYQTLREKELKTDNCKHATAQDNDLNWYKFCTTEVPNFMDSVNILSAKNLVSLSANAAVDQALEDNPGDIDLTRIKNDLLYPGDTITQLFPYFGDPNAQSANVYTTLNGICGKLTWDSYKAPNADSYGSYSEQETTANSRTIAVAQMYSSLMQVSNAMIRNAPTFNKAVDCSSLVDGEGYPIKVCADNTYAEYFFGYPLTKQYSPDCIGGTSVVYGSQNTCTDWGLTTQSAILFTGRELMDAVASYNGIMMPTLMLNQANESNENKYENMRSFIREAENKGWIMAGAYFFKLAILNNYVVSKTASNGIDVTDSTANMHFYGEQVSGAGASTPWSFKAISDTLKSTPEQPSTSATCLGGKDYAYEPFCHLSVDSLEMVGIFISGKSNMHADVPTHTSYIQNQPTNGDFDSRKLNVFTFLINQNSIVLPEQTTVLNAGLNDDAIQEFNPEQSVSELSKMSFSSGKWGISGAVSGFLWNDVVRPMWNAIIAAILPPIMTLFGAMISPIMGLAANIFNAGLDAMRIEGVNPILAIADMGVRFIDGVGDSWLAIMLYVIPAAIFPPAFALIIMLMPVVMVWMGIMVTVGFSAAFYVPFVPLLVFTFASIGWFISVMEGMVGAPIAALGVLHPEGESEAFGKGEGALMLLLNMFLRPGLMIVGYILGIALSYVGVWVMNAGFNITVRDMSFLTPIDKDNIAPSIASNKVSSMYGFWTNIMLFYFSILTYITLYVAIVHQSFELIHSLPDKILRWLAGGPSETIGDSMVKPMLAEVKQKSDSAGSESSQALAQANSGMQKITSGAIMTSSSKKEKQQKMEQASDAK